MTWPCLSKQPLIERFLQRYLKAPTDDEKYHVTGLILRIAALDTRDLARAHSRRVVQVLIQLHRLALEPPSQRLVPQLAFAWHEEDAQLLANLDRHAPRRRGPESPRRYDVQSRAIPDRYTYYLFSAAAVIHLPFICDFCIHFAFALCLCAQC